jgi:hypothetical protein
MILVVLGLGTLAQQAHSRTGSGKFYTIQMASFQKEASALDAVKKLEQKKLDAFYRPIQIADKGIWYRQYINRYSTIQAAQAGITNLRRQGIIKDAYIRHLEDGTGSQPGMNQPKLKPRPSATLQMGSSTLQNSDLATNAGAKTTQQQGDRLKIRDISVRLNDLGGDIAFIQADRYFWPIVRLNHDGDTTKLQLRIRDTEPFEKDITPQTKGGRYIQNGQIVYESDRNTLVLRLDLPGTAKYHVTQSFNHADNKFCLRLSK